MIAPVPQVQFRTSSAKLDRPKLDPAKDIQYISEANLIKSPMVFSTLGLQSYLLRYGIWTLLPPTPVPPSEKVRLEHTGALGPRRTKQFLGSKKASKAPRRRCRCRCRCRCRTTWTRRHDQEHEMYQYPDTTNGTAIYADQLGWCQRGQWGGIYGSPMCRVWD